MDALADDDDLGEDEENPQRLRDMRRQLRRRANLEDEEEVDEYGDEDVVEDSAKPNLHSGIPIPEDGVTGEEDDPFRDISRKTIVEKENSYQARRHQRELPTERIDPFNVKNNAVAAEDRRSFREVMQTREAERERQLEEEKQKQRDDAGAAGMDLDPSPTDVQQRSQWDDDAASETTAAASKWGDTPATAASATPSRRKSRWDETPVASSVGSATPSRRSRWDQTPVSTVEGTPGGGRSGRSRWDETPVAAHGTGRMTTPAARGPGGTPVATPTLGQLMMTPGAYLDAELRSRPMTDEDLDSILPPTGFKVMQAPPNYVQVNTPARKQITTPTPMAGAEYFSMGEMAEAAPLALEHLPTPKDGSGDLPPLKPSDQKHFEKLRDDVDEMTLSMDEIRERRILMLLLRIKNGTPPIRKIAMRQITDRARDLGAKPLFDKILPLLMSQSLEEQERHLLVKVIDRILYKLDDLVRPHVHQILVVVEPLLIDEDHYARVCDDFLLLRLRN